MNFRLLPSSWLFCLVLFPAIGKCETPGNSDDWVPIPQLTDEFDDAHLNQQKWFDRNPTWSGRQPVYFHKDCVELNGGLLYLKAFNAEESGKRNLPGGYTHISGFVSSRQLVRFGYFEIRAKLMNSSLVSCFWLSKHAAEEWSEIDCVEMPAGIKKHNQLFRPNLHYFYGPLYQGSHKKHWVSPSQVKLDFDPTKDFHTYGVEWDSQFLRWYVDGKMVRESPNQYHFQPLNVHINVEANNYFGATPNDNQLPSTYQVDWIRSYRKKSDVVAVQQ